MARDRDYLGRLGGEVDGAQKKSRRGTVNEGPELADKNVGLKLDVTSSSSSPTVVTGNPTIHDLDALHKEIGRRCQSWVQSLLGLVLSRLW
jgi:hypothetical protein